MMASTGKAGSLLKTGLLLLFWITIARQSSSSSSSSITVLAFRPSVLHSHVGSSNSAISKGNRRSVLPSVPFLEEQEQHQQQNGGRCREKEFQPDRRQRSSLSSSTRLYLSTPKNDDEIDGDSNSNKDNNPLSFLFNPYQSKIPKEVEQEIYEAEANTQAAKDRQKRIALYTVITIIGVLGAFFNAFLTELRSSPTPEGNADFLLSDSPQFAWVDSNIVTQFLFLNKIGGLFLLLSGCGAGLLAEAEIDTRRIQAEKIWEEMQRRRRLAYEARQGKKGGSSSSTTTASSSGSKKGKKKKRLSGKDAKRLGALAEVITPELERKVSSSMRTAAAANAAAAGKSSSPAATAAKSAMESDDDTYSAKQDANVDDNATEKDGGGGIFGSIQNFYKKADEMAASQALLLNKKLEDAGVVEKITDETGFKVIGRDAAAKLQQDEPSSSSTTTPVSDKDSSSGESKQ